MAILGGAPLAADIPTTGLVLWLDAADQATIVKSNDNSVGKWTDKVIATRALIQKTHKLQDLAAKNRITIAAMMKTALTKEVKAMLAAEACAGDQIQFPGQKTDYNGFDKYAFTVDGCQAVVVVPQKELPGRPWIWRAEFFNAFPGVDLALLEKGFHLGFIGVGNTYGCPDALAHWDVFYKDMTQKYGLSQKPALEGLSRGGLYIYNWAARNTDKVGCLYGDAPVCDFKSWPAAKGKGKGSKGDWDSLLTYYHFASEQEALDYKGNPIDNLKPLAAARIPIIHVYGDADDVVPWQENTLLVKERYEKLGGKITLIPKPGVGHHPHGLPDPTPIVQFIMKKAGH